MANGRRRRAGRAGARLGLIIGMTGTISVLVGFIIMLVALDKLLRYSPVGDPEAGRVGFTLLGISMLMIGGPVLGALGLFIARRVRQYRAWMRTLTPQERFAVHLGEAAAMEAGHIAMRDRNRREDARLSASVIGIERNGDDQQA